MNQRNDSPNAAAISPVLDATVLAELREEDDELLRELIELFFAEVPMRVQRLRSEITQRNWSAAVIDAHTLKSTTATLGAMDMSALAAEIERTARDQAAGEVLTTAIDRLDAELARVLAALEQERAK
jgi:HPt (histidine-containing phosphotransfer) domain-containing protein